MTIMKIKPKTYYKLLIKGKRIPEVNPQNKDNFYQRTKSIINEKNI